MWMTISAIFLSTRVHSVAIEDLEPGYVAYYKSWWWMKEGIKNNSIFARHHYSIMFAKDPLLAALLVFGHDIPQIQVGGIAMLNGLFMMLFIAYRPFNNNKENWVEIINYGIFWVATSIFFLLTMGVFGFTQKFKYMYISNMIIGCMVLVLFFNFWIIIKEVWEGSVKLF